MLFLRCQMWCIGNEEQLYAVSLLCCPKDPSLKPPPWLVLEERLAHQDNPRDNRA